VEGAEPDPQSQASKKNPVRLIPMNSAAQSHTGIPNTKMSIIGRPDLIAAREALRGRGVLPQREAFARSKADADGSSETGRSPPAYASGTSSGTMIWPDSQCASSAPFVTKYFAPFEGVT
jgi:hypothetical protein